MKMKLKASEFVTSLQGGQRQHILGFSSCYCGLAAAGRRCVKQVKEVGRTDTQKWTRSAYFEIQLLVLH